MEKGSNSATTNQTAEKVMVVLEALARQNQPVKLIDLSREIGMNASTLYRFLTALHNTGYVVQDEATGKYELNLRICYLSELIKKRFSIANTLHRFAVEASELFQESAHLAQVDHNMIVYVDNVVGSAAISQSLIIHQYIGHTAPMHCTGIGKLFLSEFSDTEMDKLIAEKGLQKFTEKTFVTKEALLQELEQIRVQGYAYDNEECEIGVRCVAIPIRDYTGKIVAGLSISGPASRITDEAVRARLIQLLDIAVRASAELGYMKNNICAKENI